MLLDCIKLLLSIQPVELLLLVVVHFVKVKFIMLSRSEIQSAIVVNSMKFSLCGVADLILV